MHAQHNYNLYFRHINSEHPVSNGNTPTILDNDLEHTHKNSKNASASVKQKAGFEKKYTGQSYHNFLGDKKVFNEECVNSRFVKFSQRTEDCAICDESYDVSIVKFNLRLTRLKL